MPTVTNQTTVSALRGENPLVTLNATDAALLPTLQVGQQCTITGNTGSIAELFFGGVQFRIRPQNLGKRFDSASQPGQLLAGEVITIH